MAEAERERGVGGDGQAIDQRFALTKHVQGRMLGLQSSQSQALEYVACFEGDVGTAV